MKHSGSSPCILALLTLAVTISSQPQRPAKLEDMGAERDFALGPTSTTPVFDTAIPATSDAEFTPPTPTLRLARKTPPVVKSQITITPEIPRPDTQNKDRSPPGRASPAPERHSLIRVQTRGPISSEPSESLLLG